MTDTKIADAAEVQAAPAFPEPEVPAAGGSYINHEPTGTLSKNPDDAARSEPAPDAGVVAGKSDLKKERRQ